MTEGSEQTRILVIIPARGGSKGIPRKNLRSLAGEPLISYSINIALSSELTTDVVVSSDDDEILTVAAKLGATAHKRAVEIAADATTLDPVIHAAFTWAEAELGGSYDIVVTMQPTSPLLSVDSLNQAISLMLDNPHVDTVISARNDTHLSWRQEDGSYVPDYEKRVNRQHLQPKFRETGGILATRASLVTAETRIGARVELLLLNDREAIDIDSFEDWSLCEFHLQRKRILFVVSGYPEIGLGHVYNTLLVANDIVQHEILFLVDSKSQLARDRIADRNYPVYLQQAADIIDDIRSINPDVVINDRLSTSAEYMNALKELDVRIINFEDEGPGAELADLVINAIYPEPGIKAGHYYGHRYFCLRDEFLLTEPKEFSPEVRRVLLTFGGVDPGNFTAKVLDAIHDYCLERGVEIDVVAGFGYDAYASIEPYDVHIHRDVGRISDFMASADIAFTSAGRTVFEMAAVRTPTIVLAQNSREMTHLFAAPENGFVNLGLGTEVSREQLLTEFKTLVEEPGKRRQMVNLMSGINLGQGRQNVLKLINQVLE